MRLFIDINIEEDQSIRLFSGHLEEEGCESVKEKARAENISFQMAEVNYSIIVGHIDDSTQAKIDSLTAEEWACFMNEAAKREIEITAKPVRVLSSLTKLGNWAGTPISISDIEPAADIHISSFSLNFLGDLVFSFEEMLASPDEEPELFDIDYLGMGIRSFSLKTDPSAVFQNDLISCIEERTSYEEKDDAFILSIVDEIIISNPTTI